MSANTPQNPRPGLEAQVTALLLGELSAEEAAAVRQAIAQDAELAKLHERLKFAADLVRETAHSPAAETEAQPAPLKLSAARREKLLAQFKTVAPKEFRRPLRERMPWLMPLSFAAAAVVLIGVVVSVYPRVVGRSERRLSLNLAKNVPKGATTFASASDESRRPDRDGEHGVHIAGVLLDGVPATEDNLHANKASEAVEGSHRYARVSGEIAAVKSPKANIALPSAAPDAVAPLDGTLPLPHYRARETGGGDAWTSPDQQNQKARLDVAAGALAPQADAHDVAGNSSAEHSREGNLNYQDRLKERSVTTTSGRSSTVALPALEGEYAVVQRNYDPALASEGKEVALNDQSSHQKIPRRELNVAGYLDDMAGAPISGTEIARQRSGGSGGGGAGYASPKLSPESPRGGGNAEGVGANPGAQWTFGDGVAATPPAATPAMPAPVRAPRLSPPAPPAGQPAPGKAGDAPTSVVVRNEGAAAPVNTIVGGAINGVRGFFSIQAEGDAQPSGSGKISGTELAQKQTESRGTYTDRLAGAPLPQDQDVLKKLSGSVASGDDLSRESAPQAQAGAVGGTRGRAAGRGGAGGAGGGAGGAGGGRGGRRGGGGALAQTQPVPASPSPATPPKDFGMSSFSETAPAAGPATAAQPADSLPSSIFLNLGGGDVGSGEYRLGAAKALPSGGNVIVQPNSSLDLNGNNATVSALGIAGTKGNSPVVDSENVQAATRISRREMALDGGGSSLRDGRDGRTADDEIKARPNSVAGASSPAGTSALGGGFEYIGSADLSSVAKTGGKLTLSGGNTLTLDSADTYSGGTIVASGALSAENKGISVDAGSQNATLGGVSGGGGFNRMGGGLAGTPPGGAAPGTAPASGTYEFHVQNAEPAEALGILQDIFKKNGETSSRNSPATTSPLTQRSIASSSSGSQLSSSIGGGVGGGGGGLADRSQWVPDRSGSAGNASAPIARAEPRPYPSGSYPGDVVRKDDDANKSANTTGGKGQFQFGVGAERDFGPANAAGQNGRTIASGGTVRLDEDGKLSGPAAGPAPALVGTPVPGRFSQSEMADAKAKKTVSGDFTDGPGGPSVTKSGAGNLMLNGVNTFNGGVFNGEGSYQLGSDRVPLGVAQGRGGSMGNQSGSAPSYIGSPSTANPSGVFPNNTVVSGYVDSQANWRSGTGGANGSPPAPTAPSSRESGNGVNVTVVNSPAPAAVALDIKDALPAEVRYRAGTSGGGLSFNGGTVTASNASPIIWGSYDGTSNAWVADDIIFDESGVNELGGKTKAAKAAGTVTFSTSDGSAVSGGNVYGLNTVGYVNANLAKPNAVVLPGQAPSEQAATKYAAASDISGALNSLSKEGRAGGRADAGKFAAADLDYISSDEAKMAQPPILHPKQLQVAKADVAEKANEGELAEHYRARQVTSNVTVTNGGTFVAGGGANGVIVATNGLGWMSDRGQTQMLVQNYGSPLSTGDYVTYAGMVRTNGALGPASAAVAPWDSGTAVVGGASNGVIASYVYSGGAVIDDGGSSITIDHPTLGVTNGLLGPAKVTITGISTITGEKGALVPARPVAREPDAVPRKPAPTAPIPQAEVQVHDNAFSTFSLNVSDVSFKLAAASLEKGQMPDPASVRTEEFINAFDYRDPEAAPGAPIAFNYERAHYPYAHNRDLLRFSVKTAAAGRQAGKPLNLVLLLDNSGSMERADRVQIIHEALRVLASQLRPQDKLSVVLFSRTARLWVDGVSGDQAARVAEELSGLTPEGGTNLEEAMNLAYATAVRHYLANGMNRVVLLTDGAANLGNVSPESLKAKVDANRKQGIALDCFGIGWKGYNDDLLEVLTRNGNGRYGFVNSPEEAATEFAGQLAGALHVAASDVKVQVEFNPKRVNAYRQLGYAKHQLTKEQFRDNTVTAAEIAAQEAGNALYVVEVNAGGEGPLATVRVRYREPGTSDYHEHEWEVAYTGNAPSLEQASVAMRLAGTASAFSEWLVASPYAAEVTPDSLLKLLRGVPEACGADTRPKKLETMIREAGSAVGR